MNDDAQPGRDGGGSGRGASDLDASSPPPTLPHEPLPAKPIAETSPLGALSFAFKAGYHDQEQIWLRGSAGGLVRISTFAAEPPYTDTCGAGWSTLGYVGGRFGDLQLDATGAYLLFTESLACNHARNEYPSRVLAHDLGSGTTVVLLETTGRPTIMTSAQASIVVVRHRSDLDETQPLPPGALELFELQGDALLPIEVPRGGERPYVQGVQRLLQWNDRLLLLVGGLPALERVGGAWQPSRVMDALTGVDISAIAGSPSNTRLCAATSAIKAAGGREDSVGWVLDPHGTWISTTLAEIGWVQTCLWAPDESKVAFGSLFHGVEADRLAALPFPPWKTTGLRGTWRGALHGVDVESRAIVRVDWSTLEPETVLPSDALGGPCEAAGHGEGTPQLLLPPDDRPLAIVKSSCGCIDCDISGSVTWNAETSTVSTIEDVWGEHEVYGVAWLADGGAAVLSTQIDRVVPELEPEARPEPGALFIVGADGAIDTLGPLPGVQGVLHSPLPLRAN